MGFERVLCVHAGRERLEKVHEIQWEHSRHITGGANQAALGTENTSAYNT